MAHDLEVDKEIPGFDAKVVNSRTRNFWQSWKPKLNKSTKILLGELDDDDWTRMKLLTRAVTLVGNIV